MPLEIAMVAERDTDDRPLILKIRDGDRAAFGTLVERYMRRAYYAALGLVGLSGVLALSTLLSCFLITTVLCLKRFSPHIA